MTSDVAARLVEREDKPGWWVAEARAEAARRDGRRKPYSQMDLASSIGRDRNTVYRWEAATIDFFSWAGVLVILGLEPEWEPTQPAAPRRKKTRRPH